MACILARAALAELKQAVEQIPNQGMLNNKFLILAEWQLNHIKREWQLHYNHERTHEARVNLPPGMETPLTANETVRLNDVVYSSRLEGC